MNIPDPKYKPGDLVVHPTQKPETVLTITAPGDYMFTGDQYEWFYIATDEEEFLQVSESELKSFGIDNDLKGE